MSEQNQSTELFLVSYIAARKVRVVQALVEFLRQTSGPDKPISEAVNLLNQLPLSLGQFTSEQALFFKDLIENAGGFIQVHSDDSVNSSARIYLRLATASVRSERIVYLSDKPVGVLSSVFREVEIQVEPGMHKIRLCSSTKIPFMDSESHLQLLVTESEEPTTYNLMVTPPTFWGSWSITMA